MKDLLLVKCNNLKCKGRIVYDTSLVCGKCGKKLEKINKSYTHSKIIASIGNTKSIDNI